MFSTLEISTSALVAEQLRLNAIADNIANLHSTHGAQDGGPYRRKEVIFQVGSPLVRQLGHGVTGRIQEDRRTSFEKRYLPGHPDADENGYVLFPNVKLEVELVDMIEASRAYEANVTAMDVTKGMMVNTLRLLA